MRELSEALAAAWDQGYARGSEDEFAWCGGDKRAPHENPYRVEDEAS